MITDEKSLQNSSMVLEAPTTIHSSQVGTQDANSPLFTAVPSDQM
jgi:hypothetical protein